MRISSDHPTVFSDLSWPDRSAEREAKSLIVHAAFHQPSLPPPQERLDFATKRILETYPHTTPPKGFAGPRHEVSDSQIDRALEQVKRDSSPGFPWAFLGSTKGQLVDFNSTEVREAVLSRLDVLQGRDLVKHPLTAAELVKYNYTDPVRMFGKNEPHTKAKMDAERLRLIASVSLADEIIERLLCYKQNETEIASWATCPSKPGIGFTDAQTLEFSDRVSEIFPDGLAEADVSAWDWSVQSWMLRAEVDLRIKLCGASPDSAFARILSNRIFCLGLSLFVTSDGEVFEQTAPGIMKSGSYLTSSSNSRMRNFVAHVIGAEHSMAMGDDSLESPVEDAVERYRELGIKVKFYKVTKSSYEFCSNQYTTRRGVVVAEPKNWAKGLFRLLSSKPSAELLCQFLYEYRHSPVLKETKRLILRSGWILKDNHGTPTQDSFPPSSEAQPGSGPTFDQGC